MSHWHAQRITRIASAEQNNINILTLHMAIMIA